MALRNPDDPDLTQHERQFLHHVPIEGAVSLTDLARHLALPKSTASVIVKSLARRGLFDSPEFRQPREAKPESEEPPKRPSNNGRVAAQAK